MGAMTRQQGHACRLSEKLYRIDLYLPSLTVPAAPQHEFNYSSVPRMSLTSAQSVKVCLPRRMYEL